MFTDKGQKLIDLAKDVAFGCGSPELGLPALLGAASLQPEAGVLLAECLHLTAEQLRKRFASLPEPISCPGRLPLSEGAHAALTEAKLLAEEVPDRVRPGLIDLRHLACGMSTSAEACALLEVSPCARAEVLALLASWYGTEAEGSGLQQLTEQLRALRATLLDRVFGQDHAVHAFVEGLFNAEVVAGADTGRKQPRALFVFAGPPGVGKTFLAELGAAALDRPFKRFDMSAYSGHQQNEALVGMAKSFHAAHPGTLTEFVEKNPGAVLLFDEIEKAHTNTVHLFLQILDAGTLEDKYHERNVNFRDTTIIFTTNAGRKLYDRPDESGMHHANAAFHRQTILDALASETNPTTRQPFFPAAICSRMATGYPVLFNHLRVNELERVVRAELSRVQDLFERQYFKRIQVHDHIPMCLLLREGARADARALRAQTEAFVKTEIFNICQLFHAERLGDVLEGVNGIRISLDEDPQALSPDVTALFAAPSRPRVLLIADAVWVEPLAHYVPKVEWRGAATAEDALEMLADEEIDLVLIDLWLGRSASTPMGTIHHFDHIPAGARALDKGQELLRKIRERVPGMPTYLLTIGTDEGMANGPGTVDEELFMACIRGGGARGVLRLSAVASEPASGPAVNARFEEELLAVCRRLYREKVAERLGQERKVLAFDTAPRLNQGAREIEIRLRNLRLSRAVAAADAGEVLDEVERPRVRFEDVIGATTAKEELAFFINFLRNPRRFAALGLKPPKGVLLYGPPGTGKTLLAKAMAGESDVAFIPVAASTFVTVWQGSGPQNVRDLFARARRYAPAIVFIDEVDAIGKVRSGTSGAGQGEEMALNALLTEMDGFTSPSTDRPVFVLAATNFRLQPGNEDTPERSARTLDPALVRRFSRCILVDLPDREARKQYLVLRLREGRDVAVSEDALNLLAEKSAGMSIANLEQVLETAAREALRREKEVDDELLLEALDTAREGEAKEWSPEFLESTARHEAGHTIMYWLSGWWSPEVSIVARADHGGGMRRAEAELKRESLTCEELLEAIRTSLGGRAAELLCYGRQRGLTTGASGDLQHATNLARQMILRYGMDEEFGLVALPELLQHAEALGSPLYQRASERANQILQEQMAKTSALLSENREYLDAVTNALVARNRLYRKDLEEILPARISDEAIWPTGS